MPVSVSRKVEYFVRTLGLSVDVRVFPVILTAEQVHAYHLPRMPIKDTERRRGGFEDRYGEGAVELDALKRSIQGNYNTYSASASNATSIPHWMSVPGICKYA